MEERLQKFIANQGICSRRKAEKYIIEGKVKVNGVLITELGTKINTQTDKIEVEGKLINKEIKKVYILLNKPIGYVTTAKDQFHRDTVMDLIKIKEKVVPVGRLDMYTSGALILSNDGDFIYQVTHPKHEITKTYNVTLKGSITPEEIEKLKEGVEIGEEIEAEDTKKNRNASLQYEKKEIKPYVTKPAQVRILKIEPEKNTSRIEITIHEGKNRQVRRMCEAIGRKVVGLHRSKIGNITVKDLKLGTWRYLTEKEIKTLSHGDGENGSFFNQRDTKNIRMIKDRKNRD